MKVTLIRYADWKPVMCQDQILFPFYSIPQSPREIIAEAAWRRVYYRLRKGNDTEYKKTMGKQKAMESRMRGKVFSLFV